MFSGDLLSLVFLMLAFFVALIITLRFVFSRNLENSLRQLKVFQEEASAKEANLKDEIVLARRQKQEEVEKGKSEVRRLLEVTKHEIEQMKEKAAIEAKRERDMIVAQAQELIKKESGAIVMKLNEEALSLAQAMVEKVLTSCCSDHFNRSLINELIDEIVGISADLFVVKTGKVKVISSFALKDADNKRLFDILSQKIGCPVSISNEVRPQMINGLIIEIGDLVIDGSLRNKLKKIALNLGS